MTESIRDMKAYSLLTDSILQTIMMQDKQELKEVCLVLAFYGHTSYHNNHCIALGTGNYSKVA